MNTQMLIPFHHLETIKTRCKQLNASCKTVLFIEPYGATLTLLQHGIEKHYNIIVLTAHSDLRKVPPSILNSASLSIQIDTADSSLLLDLANTLKTFCHINAVIPGFEYFVPIAATLSHALECPGIDCEQVIGLRRKDKMRLALQKSGIPQPAFEIVESKHDLKNVIKTMEFPAVCKPIDAAGSVHVKKVMNPLQTFEAAERILTGQDSLWGHRLSNTLLIEQYCPGKEYSIEGVILNNQIIYFSITEKFVSDENEFIEIGHIANVPLEQSLKTKILEYVSEVLTTLKANHCPFHAEVRVDNNQQPHLMEVAARLAGDRIGELIHLSRDVSYFDYVYAAYFGEPLEPPVFKNACAAIRFFYRPHLDQYQTIVGMDTVRQKYKLNDLRIYYAPNECIPSFPKPLRRLGHVIMTCDHYDELRNACDDIDKTIQFME